MNDLSVGVTQKLPFVMVDSSGVELVGLGTGFTVMISKNGGAFAPGTGAKSEIGSGWYLYTLSAQDTNTPGPLAVVVTAPGAAQQNMFFVVAGTPTTLVSFTYTLTRDDNSRPIGGALVRFCLDAGGTNEVESGHTNGAGQTTVWLLPGTTYYLFRTHPGYTFINPDVHVIP